MTKTQYYTATSIDGFIADEHNALDWLLQFKSSADKEGRFEAFFSGVGAMAMGATTYEWVLEHDRLLAEPDKWRDYYGDTPGWVFSHRDLPVIPGINLFFVRGGVEKAHESHAATSSVSSRTRDCSTRSVLRLTKVEHDGAFVFLDYDVTPARIRPGA